MESVFEHLSNDIIYEIFEYLDLYHVYNGFFYLNERFEYLLLGSSIPMKINTPAISKSNFEHYYKNIIIPNKNRINILRLSNPFTIDIVFSPPRVISEFIQLETLILDNMTNSLYEIFQELMYLTNLNSLTLNIVEYTYSSTEVFSKLFRLSKLKYCKIKYRIITNDNPLPNSLSISPIEHLIINAPVPHNSLYSLIHAVPKLRRLSINYLTRSSSDKDEHESCPIQLPENLKYISFTLDLIKLNEFEKIIKNFFGNVEVLTISTNYDEAYLDANKWEHIISSYMPNLRIFDIKHDGCVSKSASTYHQLINHFSSSYWITKQWFFTHQHNWLQRVNSGIFYSAEPYRRNDYTFYWQLDKQICPYIQTTNLNSVRYVYICGIKANNNGGNYFPNAIELTIEQYFETFDDPLTEILDRIVPLNKITKMIIKKFHLHFKQLIAILYYTCRLNTIETDHLHNDNITPVLFQKDNSFQYISKTNKVKIFNLVYNCTSEKTQLILNLFPDLEQLKIGMKNKAMITTVEYILLNKFNNTSTLFFLCITDISIIYVNQVIELIETKKLPDDYCIKFINQDLYLWW